VEQRAILPSFESVKKTEDDARVCEEANEEQWRHNIDVSIQHALIEEAGHRFFVKERRALFAVHRRERWRAAARGDGEAEGGRRR
jgi:hypothetical protein